MWRQEWTQELLCNRQCPARRGELAFALIGRAGMPFRIGEMQAAKPQAAAGAAAFRRTLTRVVASGNALAKSAPGRFFLRLLHTSNRRTQQSIHQTGPAGGTYTQQSGGQLENGRLFQMYALRSDLCSAALRVRFLRSRRPLLRIADQPSQDRRISCGPCFRDKILRC
jgi:hypothetical protein